MRLQIPNFLQKEFKALMKLAYLLKKTNPDLRRNVKFDEENIGLFLDMQTKKEGQWKRVRPEEAKKALNGLSTDEGPAEADAEELLGLIDPDSSE